MLSIQRSRICFGRIDLIAVDLSAHIAQLLGLTLTFRSCPANVIQP